MRPLGMQDFPHVTRVLAAFVARGAGDTAAGLIAPGGSVGERASQLSSLPQNYNVITLTA